MSERRNWTSLHTSQSAYLFGLTEPVRVPYDETVQMRVVHLDEQVHLSRHHESEPELQYRVRVSGYRPALAGEEIAEDEEWGQVEYAEGAIPEVLTPHLTGPASLLEILRADITREATLLGMTSTTLTATID